MMKGWVYEIAEDADYNGGRSDHPATRRSSLMFSKQKGDTRHTMSIQSKLAFVCALLISPKSS